MAELVGRPLLRKLFPKRPDWSHKGDFGKLLIIAGSRNCTGAPVLTSLAALRTGADLVIAACPENASAATSTFPDIITFPLKGDRLSEKHVSKLLTLSLDADAVVIGGGLGQEKHTQKAVVNFLKKLERPCVIDADAIRALSGNMDILKKGFVLTPHANEFLSLTGEDPRKEIEDRKRIAMMYAGRLGTNLLLKGHVDIITDGSRVCTNKTGNPFMTKGGTGETLSGICGALLAMKADPFDAACAAAYINGAAGDRAARKFGQGMLASDLVQEIPNIIKQALK